jgi:hypothetical protein
MLSKDKHRFDMFLKYFRQLLKYNIENNDESAFFLKKYITEDTTVISHRWLLEKVNSII